jgi:hypothetical protein
VTITFDCCQSGDSGGSGSASKTSSAAQDRHAQGVREVGKAAADAADPDDADDAVRQFAGRVPSPLPALLLTDAPEQVPLESEQEGEYLFGDRPAVDARDRREGDPARLEALEVVPVGAGAQRLHPFEGVRRLEVCVVEAVLDQDVRVGGQGDAFVEVGCPRQVDVRQLCPDRGGEVVERPGRFRRKLVGEDDPRIGHIHSMPR